MINIFDTVSAGFNEFGFNQSFRFNELVFNLKYFLLYKNNFIPDLANFRV